MKKSLLLLAALLLTATQTVQAMHQQKFHIKCYDQTFEVSPNVIEQFPVLWAQARFTVGEKVQQLPERKIDQDIEITRKEKLEETVSRQAPLGSKKNPWDITNFVKEVFGEDPENELKRKYNRIFGLKSKRVTPEKKEEFFKKLEKQLESFAIFPKYDKDGKRLRFEVPPKSEAPWTPKAQKLQLVQAFLNIAEGDTEALEESNETGLFKLAELAEKLGNDFVREKCTQALMKKMKLAGSMTDPTLAGKIEAQSEKPGLYPMSNDLFLFRQSEDKVSLYNFLEKKSVRTFYKKNGFLNIEPLKQGKFLSDYRDESMIINILLWDIRKDKPLGEVNGYIVSILPDKEHLVVFPFHPSRYGEIYTYVLWLAKIENDKIQSKHMINPNHQNKIWRAYGLPNSNQVILESRHHSQLYDAFQKRQKNPKDLSKYFETSNIASIPNTNLFLCGQKDSIALCNLDKPKPLVEFKTNNPSKIIALNQNFFCSRSDQSNTILTWNINQLEPIGEIKHPEPVQAMALMPPEGKYLLSWAGGKIYIWDLAPVPLSFEQLEFVFRVFYLGQTEPQDGDMETLETLPKDLQNKVWYKFKTKFSVNEEI